MYIYSIVLLDYCSEHRLCFEMEFSFTINSQIILQLITISVQLAQYNYWSIINLNPKNVTIESELIATVVQNILQTYNCLKCLDVEC